MSDDSARLDLWLFNVRFFRSRSLAAEAVHGGLVHLNGTRVKPAKAVKAGDVVSFRRDGVVFDCAVLSLPDRRGPATVAQAAYRESQESAARRAQHAETMRVAAASGSAPGHRPNRQERQQLRRLRGRD
jgi:ribosome-associated heat shock protein Hsp15